jgi:putative oxidoreductase
MRLGLEGSTAVVTGASRGIGLETVRVLAGEGAHVVAVSRTATAELTAIDGVRHVAVDLIDPDAAAAVADAADDADVLVNNAGGVLEGSMAADGFLALDDATWRATFDLNLFSAVRVTRALLPGLLRRRGVVISVSSIGARAAYPPVDYGAAKAALTNLSKALSEEFGPAGLRALTVSPGPTRTRNWADPDGYAGRLAAARGVSLDDYLRSAAVEMGLSIGRLSEPEETAALIAFLASPRAANVTGADVLADGGAIKTV